MLFPCLKKSFTELFFQFPFFEKILSPENKIHVRLVQCLALWLSEKKAMNWNRVFKHTHKKPSWKIYSFGFNPFQCYFQDFFYQSHFNIINNLPSWVWNFLFNFIWKFFFINLWNWNVMILQLLEFEII